MSRFDEKNFPFKIILPTKWNDLVVYRHFDYEESTDVQNQSSQVESIQEEKVEDFITEANTTQDVIAK